MTSNKNPQFLVKNGGGLIQFIFVFPKQIGRTAWLKSVDGQSIEYPELKKLKEVSSPEEVPDLTKNFKSSSPAGAKFHAKPLEGFVVVDFSNVLAGPNCGRMLCELGATVYKVFLYSKF